MQKTRLAFVAALLVAVHANAGTMTLELDKNTYSVGEDIVITATGTLLTTDVVQTLGYVAIAVSFDSTVATAKNSPGGAGFGFATQLVTEGPNAGESVLAGPYGDFVSDDATCTSADICSVLLQPYFGTAGFSPANQTVVGTLVLKANAVGSLGLGIYALSFIDGFANVTDPNAVTLGPNWAGAQVVPEPTPALLLGLGLLGLGATRRGSRSARR
jgi:hypothetical protein